MGKKARMVDAFGGTLVKKTGIIEKVGDVSLELHQASVNDPRRIKFEKVLSQWINEYTAHTHLVVRNFCEDLRTGQIFICFLQQIGRDDIAHNEFAQSDQSHKSNLAALLHYVLSELEIQSTEDDWNVEELFRGNWAHIYNLAVALAHHFECPYDLPSNLRINIIRREKVLGGNIIKKTTQHIITADESPYHEANRIRRELKNLPMQDFDDEIWWALTDDDDRVYDRDAFDELYESRAEKVAQVKSTLIIFCNKHLKKLDLEVTDLVEDFQSGVFLIYLIGLLSEIFVPLANYNPEPDDYPSKLHNVRFSFKLLDDADVSRLNCRSGDVARGDERTVLRLLFQIFQKYKGAE